MIFYKKNWKWPKNSYILKKIGFSHKIRWHCIGHQPEREFFFPPKCLYSMGSIGTRGGNIPNMEPLKTSKSAYLGPKLSDLWKNCYFFMENQCPEYQTCPILEANPKKPLAIKLGTSNSHIIRFQVDIDLSEPSNLWHLSSKYPGFGPFFAFFIENQLK